MDFFLTSRSSQRTFACTPEHRLHDFIHRRSGDTDIHFVRSAYAQPRTFSVAFVLTVR
jgi:hypothetical protein